MVKPARFLLPLLSRSNASSVFASPRQARTESFPLDADTLAAMPSLPREPRKRHAGMIDAAADLLLSAGPFFRQRRAISTFVRTTCCAGIARRLRRARA